MATNRENERQIRMMMEAAKEQGFRIKPTDKGWMVYGKAPDTRMVLLHKGPSDPRGVKNSRAKLRRMGVTGI